VVSLTFSVTVVALTVSSQHFGPRLLTNFMRDTSTQVVLGVFIGTFAFCLVVLRTVQGDGDGYQRFVPHLSVSVAVALALLTVAALIYYLHHVAASMQVAQIAANVTRDLESAIDRLYPDEAGNEREPSAPEVPPEPADGVRAAAGASGYVQAIDLDAMMALAEAHSTTVWLRKRPGDFVITGAELAAASPAPSDPEAFAGALRQAFILGLDRTPWQDAEFAVQQLVEVALHALSPGMNEPFTAITCIDRLGQGLARMLTRRMPSPLRTNDRQQVRLVTDPRSFASLLRSAFDPIARFAGPNPAIYQRLLETLAELGARARRAPDRAALREMAAAIRAKALQELQADRPRAAIEEQHARVLAAVTRG
jgi:uncharacterized membrane protein